MIFTPDVHAIHVVIGSVRISAGEMKYNRKNTAAVPRPNSQVGAGWYRGKRAAVKNVVQNGLTGVLKYSASPSL